MAFLEYILLAFIGSTGAAAPGTTPRSPATPTLGADIIVQPAGGAASDGDFKPGTGLFGQATGGSTDRFHKGGRAQRHYSKVRHHRRGHHRRVFSHKGGKKG